MNSWTIHPVAVLNGSLQVPGDKSISQRAAMLAGLAEGTTEITGFLQGEDALSALNAMQALGAEYALDDDRLRICGTAGRLCRPAGPLDMGNSGTGTRLLAGILAGQPFDTTLTGDTSLSRRPMGRIAEPLRRMGAAVELSGEKGTLPMTVRGGSLQGIEYVLPMASAQVKSCVLLAGLFAEGRTSIREPQATRDHTERMLHLFGVQVETDGLRISVGRSGLRSPGRLSVPADISSAAFWLAAAAGKPGSRVRLTAVGLNPRRTAVLDALRRMGADVAVENFSDGPEPCGDLVVHGTRLRGTVIEGAEIPNLIDELPVLAMVAATAEGMTEIRDAAELRVKESDRIALICQHLRACGAEVEERADGMRITGSTKLQIPEHPLESDGDHRIAMASAVLALSAPGPVTVADTGCVNTSYPGFMKHLNRLAGRD